MMIKRFLAVAFVAASLTSICSRADDAAPAGPPTAAKTPGVTLVNLHLDKAMPLDAFDELSRQSGIKFITNGNIWEQEAMQTEMDVNIDNRPFWSAVTEVCGMWNVAVQPNNYGNNNSARRITLMQNYVQGEKVKLPTFEADGFVVQAVSFNRNQTVNYAWSQQSQDSCGVQLMVYIDPSLHILTFSPMAKVSEATDDAGHSMLANANSNTFYNDGQQRSLVYNCTAPLKYPENAGKKIAHLKCVIQMRGSESVDTMTVDKPLEAAESSKDFDDTSIFFHSLKKIPGGNYELKIGISKDDNQQGGQNLWNIVQAGQLLDAKGRPFSNFGGGGGGGNGISEYTVNYFSNNSGNSGASGEPVKWVLEMPTKTHAIKLPVEFKDLPLP